MIISKRRFDELFDEIERLKNKNKELRAYVKHLEETYVKRN